jgi:hypothetical protein
MRGDAYYEEKSFWKVLKSIISTSSLVSLIFVAIIILIFSVFVFGDHGSHSNSNAAELLSTVGIGVLSALVATVVDRSISARNLEARITKNFREAAEIATSLTDLGIYTAHAKFDFGQIFKEAKRGETVSWLDTYCPRQNEFIDDVVAALRRGVKVRMLIIDPDCDNSRFRNQELESTVDTGGGWVGGLEAFTSKMTAVAERGYGKFDIRYYRDLPCVPMYLVGRAPSARKAYFSIFLVRATAGCQHVELTRGDWLADMAKYFEQKWNRQPEIAVPLPTGKTN